MSEAVRTLEPEIETLRRLLAEATPEEKQQSWWTIAEQAHLLLKNALVKAKSVPALCRDCGKEVSDHQYTFCARCGDARGP